MKILLLLILLDITIGILCGVVHNNLNSRAGLLGLIKHSVVILIVIAFIFIGELYDVEGYIYLIKIFYFIQYGISILENVYCLGVPIPNFLVARLKDYQEKEGFDRWEK